MKKWLGIAGIAVLAIVIITVIALANLNSLINSHKDYLLARAQESLGRTMSVGEIAVTLWGGIGVRLKQFALSDDPAFSKDPFVSAADLQVNVKLMPLLKKELEIRNMVLHKPVINVMRDKTGRFNFSSIGGDKEKKDKAAKEKEKERAEKGGAPPLAVSLVDVDGGELRYS